MPDTTVETTVPEVGDIVRHQGRYHVVHGWLRSPTDTDADADDSVSRRLLFATRANATHLRLRNTETGNTAVRLTDITTTDDRPAFTPNTIRAAHQLAEKLDGTSSDHYDTFTAAPDAEEKP